MASLANRVDGTVYAPGKTFPWVTRVAVVEAVLRHNNALRVIGSQRRGRGVGHRDLLLPTKEEAIARRFGGVTRRTWNSWVIKYEQAFEESFSCAHRDESAHEYHLFALDALVPDVSHRERTAWSKHIDSALKAITICDDNPTFIIAEYVITLGRDYGINLGRSVVCERLLNLGLDLKKIYARRRQVAKCSRSGGKSESTGGRKLLLKLHEAFIKAADLLAPSPSVVHLHSNTETLPVMFMFLFQFLFPCSFPLFLSLLFFFSRSQVRKL